MRRSNGKADFLIRGHTSLRFASDHSAAGRLQKERAKWLIILFSKRGEKGKGGFAFHGEVPW
ncbi:MAG TPA: hypothetical protein DIV80_05850 [Synergistaceae bacterium]|nr:hypothetical protein [Synergistaceae bacterium]